MRNQVADSIWDRIWIEAQDIPPWDDMCENILIALERIAGPLAGKTVLECGAGSGRISVEMARRGAKVTTLDKSPASLQLIRTLAKKKGVSMAVVEGDVFTLPFADDAFDLVWSAGLLEHFSAEDQRKILVEMRRVCRHDGLVIGVVPYIEALYLFAKWWAEKTGSWPYGKETPMKTMKPLFEEAGLHVLGEETVNFGDSVRLLQSLPFSAEIRNLVHLWFDTLPEGYREALPGRWLVTVGRPAVTCSQTRTTSSEPTLRATTNVTLICLSSIRWDELWQRPQHIMSRLASMGYLIFFVEPSQGSLHLPGQRELDVAALRSHLLAATLTRMIRRGERIFSVTPITTAVLENGEAQYVLPLHVQMLADTLANGPVVYWVLTPLWNPLIRQLPAKDTVIYDCVDDHRFFPGAQAEAVGREETWLAKRAQVVLTSSRKLWRDRIQNANALFLPNGAATKLFASRGRLPEELRYIPRPRIGFSGAVAKWIDLDLLQYVAKNRPDWHLVVVGQVYVDIGSLVPLKNIHFLGRKSYEDLPAYIGNFDVGIMPFRMDDPLVQAVNPIKLYEYLAAGVPVVSTWWPEMEEFSDVVRLCRTREEFVASLEKTLQAPPDKQELQARVKDYDWDTIAALAAGVIEAALVDVHKDWRRSFEIWNRLVGRTRWLAGPAIFAARAAAVGGAPDLALETIAREGGGPEQLGWVVDSLHKSGDREAAELLLRKMVLTYDDVDSLFNLAVIDIELGRDTHEALRLLGEVLRRNPDDQQARSLFELLSPGGLVQAQEEAGPYSE